MASVATSNITYVGIGGSIRVWGGDQVEVWRIASGQAPGDTAVITPTFRGLVQAVIGPVQNNIATTPVSTVTVTISGNGSTATVGQIDVLLVKYPQR